MTSDKVIKTLVISLFSIGGFKLMSKKVRIPLTP